MQVSSPALSVLLLLPYGFADIEQTLQCLSDQTLAGALELVCVLPPAHHHEQLPARFQEHFHSIQRVLADRLSETGHGYALATRAASAEVVVVAEEHGFPYAGWAEALLRRHDEGWAAVGAVVENGNPRSAVSWASFLINFGMAAENASAGPKPYLASHQTSYKRDKLLRYGERLPWLLGMEARLQEQLHADGERCFLEPAARVRHYNVELWPTFLAEQSKAPRQYASLRAEGWPVWKRLLYAAAAPLIWAVRFKRTWQYTRQCPLSPKQLPGISIAMGFGLLIATVAEVSGYLFGAGNVGEQRFPLEFRRREQVRSCELTCNSA